MVRVNLSWLVQIMASKGDERHHDCLLKGVNIGFFYRCGGPGRNEFFLLLEKAWNILVVCVFRSANKVCITCVSD